jgi:integrase
MASRTPAGTWQGSYLDATGKRVKSSFATQKQAEAWERAGKVARDNVRAGIAPSPLQARRLDTLWPGWLARRPAKRAKDDASRWAHHVGPFFGAFDANTITKETLAEFVRHMEKKSAARPGQAAGKPLKPNTIKRCLVLICQLVADLTDRRLTYDYSVQLNPPVWIESREDVAKLIEACDGWLRIAAAIALYAGLRKGEVAGLRKRAINFQLATIEVSKSYDGPVKSKHYRFVPLADELRAILKPWVEKLEPDDLVIKIDGEMMREDYDIATRVERAAARAGVRSVNFHQLRHTFASHLAQTKPLTVVGSILGHADTQTTARYAHVNNEALARDRSVHLSFGVTEKKRRPGRPKKSTA